MKRLLIFALALNCIYAGSIQSNLAKSKEASAALSKKLEDLAADIINGENALKSIDEKVAQTATKTKELQELVNAQNGELDVMILQNKDLIANKNSLEKKLIDLISKKFSYDLIAPKDMIEGAKSILNAQVLASLSKILKKEFVKLGKNYELTINQINTKQQKIASINDNISEFKKQTAKLQALKTRQQNLLKKQKDDEKEYKRRLDALAKEQAELAQTLKNLKIMQEQSIKTQSASIDKVKHSNELDYSSAVGKYTGAKLLAPLDGFSLKQGFGYYVDPIYKLKIFNENVILKSNTPNANVRVIADGKVVYVGETAVLEKVVIIEHAGGLHSIYAHLDKFSKLAKVGNRLRAGNIIGKVRQELTFEITQKSAHIDPMTAIKH